MEDALVPRIRQSRACFFACVVLLLTFVALSWSAVTTKCATMDEPLHAVAAYTHTFLHDFRDNPEDPPLWKYWAMLPHSRRELNPDLARPRLSDPKADFVLGATLLYRTPGFDGAAFLNRSRAMMLLLGMALAVVLMVWAWEVAGPIAGVTAGAFFCLDPNFLAHAALMKNDVAISLVMFAMVFAVYRLGRRVTVWTILAATLLCAIGPTVKFSGVLLLPMLVLLLVARALFGGTWLIFGREVVARSRKLLVAVAVTAASGVATFVLIWACYGFRYLPTPDSQTQFDFATELKTAARNAFYVRYHRWPDATDRVATPLLARGIAFMNHDRLLPQAWLFGLLYTYQTTLVRPAFLLGHFSNTGWWYYFPLAMLFKTPLATLLALAIAISLLIRKRSESGWLATCVAIPIALYGYSAMMTSLNLGLRHVLPIYPFLFLLIGIGLARLRIAMLTSVLVVGLGAATALAYPNYIPFFNAIARPYRLKLLSDSNLDWGQDLPALSRWQQKHPNVRLYLCYFGSADPGFYGIRYINLPSGYFLNSTAQLPDKPGVIAVSATKLQGMGVYENVQAFYARLRRRQPMAVLDDSIYLFDFAPSVNGRSYSAPSPPEQATRR